MGFSRISSKGFTIIEIMIAISVFSMAMMLVMEVVIGMGKQYQKASYTTQLNSASRSFHEEIANDINYGSTTPLVANNGTELRWICLSGSIMYAWRNSVNGNPLAYGLFKGQDSNCTNATLAPASAANIINNGFNLLPANSFVKNIEINLEGSGLYSLKTDFRSGAQDMFVDSDISKDCLPTLRGGDFCSVVQYNNVVRQRL